MIHIKKSHAGHALTAVTAKAMLFEQPRLFKATLHAKRATQRPQALTIAAPTVEGLERAIAHRTGFKWGVQVREG